MNIGRDNVVKIIFEAIENLNEERSGNDKIAPSESTALFGGTSALDSLSLVSVIVDVEAKMQSEFGITAMLTDDRAMSRKISPFTSVQSLADYIIELLATPKN
jgi:acyl carrier protein